MQVRLVSFHSWNHRVFNSGKPQEDGGYTQTTSSNGFYPRYFYYPNNISFMRNDAKVVKDMANMPCLCCGIRMVTTKEFLNISPVELSKPAPIAIKALSRFEAQMHTVERICFEKLKLASERYPSKTLKQILAELQPRSLERLQKDQLTVLDRISKVGEKTLSEDSLQKLKAFLSDYRPSVMNTPGIEPFKRKKFILSLDEFLQTLPETEAKEKILKAAYKLNKSGNDVNSFIVKYADKSSGEIGKGLVLRSVKTKEHLVAQHSSDGTLGSSKEHNIGYTCQRCNNVDKRNIPISQWAEGKPEMCEHYAQEHFNFMLTKIESGFLSQSYREILLGQARTLIEGSQGKIKINIAKLTTESEAYQAAG